VKALGVSPVVVSVVVVSVVVVSGNVMLLRWGRIGSCPRFPTASIIVLVSRSIVHPNSGVWARRSHARRFKQSISTQIDRCRLINSGRSAGHFRLLKHGPRAVSIAKRTHSSLRGACVVELLLARAYTQQLAAFLKALREAGYVDGQNVKIEYRWAEDQTDRLPAMVADLVQKQVAVVVAAFAASAAGVLVAAIVRPVAQQSSGHREFTPRMDCGNRVADC
jgi:hypothetical protein